MTALHPASGGPAVTQAAQPGVDTIHNSLKCHARASHLSENPCRSLLARWVFPWWPGTPIPGTTKLDAHRGTALRTQAALLRRAAFTAGEGKLTAVASQGIQCVPSSAGSPEPSSKTPGSSLSFNSPHCHQQVPRSYSNYPHPADSFWNQTWLCCLAIPVLGQRASLTSSRICLRVPPNHHPSPPFPSQEGGRFLSLPSASLGPSLRFLNGPLAWGSMPVDLSGAATRIRIWRGVYYRA